MTKEERIRAAIAGEKPDTIPFSFWSHFPETDLDPEAIAEETCRFALEYDIDLIKTMNNGMYSVEDFGAVVDYSGIAGGGVAKLREIPVKTARDWEALEPASIETGALNRELVYLKKLLEKMKGLHAPVVFTVFSPLTTAHKLCGGSLNHYIREEGGEALKKALSAITQTTAQLAARAIELGASGIFLASQMSNSSMMSDEEYLEYGKPYDLSVLKAAEQGWCNILHAHGNDILFDILRDYPVQIFNWHVWESLPDIEEGSAALDKCILGGMERMDITKGDKNRVRSQIFHTIQATGGKNLILAPGCVVRHPLDKSMLSYIQSAKREIEQRL